MHDRSHITRSLLLGSLLFHSGCEAAQEERRSTLSLPRGFLSEELRVGSLEGPTALTRVTEILPVAEGGAWIVQPEDRLILAFDGSGNLVGRVGGPGQGPGEFTSPSRLGWWAGGTDTVWVAEFIPPRVSLFTSGGEFVRSFPVPHFDYGAEHQIQLPSTFLADGTALALADHRPGVQNWTSVPIVRYDPARAAVTGEVTRVSRTSTIQIGSGGPRGIHPIPDAPIVAYGIDRVMILDRTAPGGVEGGEIVISMYDPAGASLWSRSYPYQPEPLPVQEADSLIGDRIAAFQRFAALEGRWSPEEAERVYRAEVRAPTHRPPVRSAHLAPDGRLWLQWQAAPGASVEWWVLDAEGEPQASFTTPDPLDVRAVAGDHLWAVATDELDVPYVVRYRFNTTLP